MAELRHRVSSRRVRRLYLAGRAGVLPTVPSLADDGQLAINKTTPPIINLHRPTFKGYELHTCGDCKVGRNGVAKRFNNPLPLDGGGLEPALSIAEGVGVKTLASAPFPCGQHPRLQDAIAPCRGPARIFRPPKVCYHWGRRRGRKERRKRVLPRFLTFDKNPGKPFGPARNEEEFYGYKKDKRQGL